MIITATSSYDISPLKYIKLGLQQIKIITNRIKSIKCHLPNFSNSIIMNPT
jgi:hypothetical protein